MAETKSQDSSLAIYHRGNSHKRTRATKKEKKRRGRRRRERAAAWRNVKSHEWYPIQNLGQLNWMDRWTFVGLLCGKQQEKSSRWIRQRRNDLSSLNKKTRMKHSNVITWNEISKLIFSAVLQLATGDATQDTETQYKNAKFQGKVYSLAEIWRIW